MSLCDALNAATSSCAALTSPGWPCWAQTLIVPVGLAVLDAEGLVLPPLLLPHAARARAAATATPPIARRVDRPEARVRRLLLMVTDAPCSVGSMSIGRRSGLRRRCCSTKAVVIGGPVSSTRVDDSAE